MIQDNLLKKQPTIYKQFNKILKNHRLTHAYLFNGLTEYGTLDCAKFIAQSLFCSQKELYLPCGHCLNCKAIEEDTFLNVEYIQPDGASIKVEQIRHLKNSLNYSNLNATKKIYIIEKCELMTNSAVNSLLKFLEEPHPHIYFFLLTENKNLLLPTVLSRVQIFDFAKISSALLQEQLVDSGISTQKSIFLSKFVSSIEEANQLIEEENFDQFLQDILRFTQMILEKDKQAYIFVQKNLQQYFSNKTYVSIALDLMTLYCRDNYMYHQHIDDIYFTLYSHQFQKSKIKKDLSELLLKVRVYIKANVSVQNAFELLCVETLQL